LSKAPYRLVVVDRYRIIDLQVFHRSAHVVDVFLEGELGRVCADHDESAIRVSLGPRPDIGERSQPVDAGVGPELDENHLSAQAGRRQGVRIEPCRGAGQRSQVTVGGLCFRRANHAELGADNCRGRSGQKLASGQVRHRGRAFIVPATRRIELEKHVELS
jgi:hypothetical protein